MNLELEKYEASRQLLPGSGQQIVAHYTNDELVVYQAYKPSIAEYAVVNQQLGGNDFSYNRMSWIKPNFLWMMYRCGWAEKENQERVIAIWIKKEAFVEILEHAAISSFKPRLHQSYETWKKELHKKEARLQWDPDHDPFGNKLTRRAIQLGLKGSLLKDFGTKKITRIEDITPFVKTQKLLLNKGLLNNVMVPVERVWNINNPTLEQKTGIGHGHDNTL